MIHRIFLASVFLIFAISATCVQAQRTDWVDHNDGNWDDSGNWTAGVPGASSNVFVNIGQVTHDTVGGSTIRRLTYGFGTSDLALETDLTVTDRMDWTGATVSGAAKLILLGENFVEDGKLEGTVDSHGEVTAAPFVFFNGAGGTGVWNNKTGSIFNLDNEAGLAFDSQFNNEAGALLRKLNFTSASRIGWDLNSAGTIQVDGGSLILNGNSFIDGNVELAAGGALDLGTIKDYSFGANAVVNGGGELELSAGTTTIDNTLNVNSRFKMDGTSLMTGTGVLNVNGFMTWESGRMEGSGVTNLNGDSQISGGTTDRTINNFGDTNFRPGVFFAGGEATSVWNNKAGSELDITNDGGFAFAGTFNNEAGAVFKKSGAGQSTISWNFCNQGTLEIQNGEIWFQGDFKNDGGSISMDGGNLRISNWENSSTGSLSGDGTITASEVTINGTLSPGFSPGTLSFTGDLILTSTALLEFELGTFSDLVNVAGDLTLDGTLNLSALTGFADGDYVLFDYEGALIDNGMDLGMAPSGFDVQIINDTGAGQISARISSVPEPGSVVVLAALGVLGFVRRRRLA